MQEALNDPKVVTGIIVLLVAFVIIILMAFAGKKQPKLKPKPVEEERELSAAALLHQMLSNRKWRHLSFDTLSHHIGGYEGDDLRRLLVEAGAIRFVSRTGEELWGLLERNQRRVGALPEPADKPVREKTTSFFGLKRGSKDEETAEKPASPLLTGRLKDLAADPSKQTDKPADKPADKPTDKHMNTLKDKFADKPADQQAPKTSERTELGATVSDVARSS